MNMIMLWPIWHWPPHSRHWRCPRSQGLSSACCCTSPLPGSSSVWGLYPHMRSLQIEVCRARPLYEMSANLYCHVDPGLEHLNGKYSEHWPQEYSRFSEQKPSWMHSFTHSLYKESLSAFHVSDIVRGAGSEVSKGIKNACTQGTNFPGEKVPIRRDISKTGEKNETRVEDRDCLGVRMPF